MIGRISFNILPFVLGQDVVHTLFVFCIVSFKPLLVKGGDVSINEKTVFDIICASHVFKY